MLTVALIFGGKSPEHDVSINSARNIYGAIDKTRFQLCLIGVGKGGRWFKLAEDAFLSQDLRIEDGEPLAVIPGAERGQIIRLEELSAIEQLDVVFPIIHGPYGEDGSLQGMLKQLNLPFVGPDVLGSAVSMDKDVSKRLLREADLKVAEAMTFYYFEKEAIDYTAVVNQLGLPLFVKPANMGSSVGVKKADTLPELKEAMATAFLYDHKIIVEEGLKGREIECAVMGNALIETTGVGEVVMDDGFYDYDAKYESEEAAKVQIPAKDIDAQMLAKLMLVAKNAYRVLGCEGMTRVDMFLDPEGNVYVNEVNTLPGFTDISMYPKLWVENGVPYAELISLLIDLAVERGDREAALEKNR
ncbi:MAG: D-alanine--D-alanine ligase [Bacteroidota bacterium]